MNIIEVSKKENIGKVYEIFLDGVNRGKWEIEEIKEGEFEFFNTEGEPLDEIYFISQITRMEFEEAVDWSKVPVDTLVEASDDGENFIKRHFAKYERGVIFAWGGGRSSKTAYSENDVVGWKMANIIKE